MLVVLPIPEYKNTSRSETFHDKNIEIPSHELARIFFSSQLLELKKKTEKFRAVDAFPFKAIPLKSGMAAQFNQYFP
ncbi:MAG: hypothetical protein LUE08_03210 [Akkermansiaceae bacterium]|nr:hypothetical protein [Akkermansiaceae bacterium]